MNKLKSLDGLFAGRHFGFCRGKNERLAKTLYDTDYLSSQ
ncbi:hypothetical protein QFZ98_004656 [Paraburkholderia youngii]